MVVDGTEQASKTSHGILSGIAMSERREKRTTWIQRGKYAVELEVEVVYPLDDTSEPCLEPATVRWLDEVANKAEQGDLDYLHEAGRVFQALPQ